MKTDAIAAAEQYIRSCPASRDATILSGLVRALRTGEQANVHDLYDLNLNAFEMAIDVLNEWRLQRYYRGGAVAAVATLGH